MTTRQLFEDDNRGPVVQAALMPPALELKSLRQQSFL
jgi:hypothetical protein